MRLGRQHGVLNRSSSILYQSLYPTLGEPTQLERTHGISTRGFWSLCQFPTLPQSPGTNPCLVPSNTKPLKRIISLRRKGNKIGKKPVHTGYNTPNRSIKTPTQMMPKDIQPIHFTQKAKIRSDQLRPTPLIAAPTTPPATRQHTRRTRRCSRRAGTSARRRCWR